MKKTLIGLSLFSIFSSSVYANDVPILKYKKNEVNHFINELSKENIYTKKELLNFFKETKIKQSVKSDNKKQPEKILTWETYKDKVVTNNKIQEGKKFIKENSYYLNKAEKKFGVPKEVITAIIGIESFYGKYKGDHNAIDAISTMAFEGSEKRQKFFKNELKSYFTYTYKNKLNPLELKSSWAGAFGYPQFISSSILHYGVDFNNDGKVDLFNSIPDSIGSVANYLAKSGWKKDDYIALPVKYNGSYKFNYSTINLPYTIDFLEKNNVIIPKNMRKTKPVKIFKLNDNNVKTHYWIGFNNYKAITLYNRSDLYAMAVFELANSIADKTLK